MLKIKNAGTRQKSPRRHPLKLTSLMYLKEALLRERYEECATIIALAKEFGASESEIGYLLEDPRRRPG